MHHDAEGLTLIEEDIDRQASVLRAGAGALREAAGDIVEAIPRPPSRVYLIGCGDSLDAGIAARFVWESMFPFPVEAVPAMTFATSVVDLAPAGSLVVALSQSGKVSRVVEAVRAAAGRGLSTVTITANGSSALAQEPSDATWVIDFEKVGAVPGTTSHLLGIAALYELGCALAVEAVQAGAVRDALDLLPDLVDEAVRRSRPIADRHAASIDRDHPFLALGYGPSMSSARFTVRKLLELTQLIALSQETEEYAHDEYSLVDERFRVMLFAPPGAGANRSGEVATYLRRLGVHLSIVTSDGTRQDQGVADVVYSLPDAPAPLMPLVYAVPGQLLSVASGRRVGGSLYGMAERVHREDGDPQIYESEIAS
jgi:glucosamine--fructose-6-phosphate aminotransferase (isomerizing)